MRSLSPEEAELWAQVTASIRPLSREPLPRSAAPQEAPRQEAEAAATPPRRPVARPQPQPASPARLQRLGNNLDGRWDKRLRSGSVEPDRIVDLHGMNLERAWNAIDLGLERAIGAGDRVVLLITGHHRPGEPPVERGRIRAAVHDWLSASRHAPRIAAVRNAHRRHGGGGSLYIVLRRR